MALGTLRLNGVLIPKDLSNLNYDQIMALLDSVNLPSTQAATAKDEVKTATPASDLVQAAKESTTKMPKSQLYEHKYVNGRDYRKTGGSQAIQNHNGNFGMATTAYSHQQAKKYNGSFSSAKSNQFMG